MSAWQVLTLQLWGEESEIKSSCLLEILHTCIEHPLQLNIRCWQAMDTDQVLHPVHLLSSAEKKTLKYVNRIKIRFVLTLTNVLPHVSRLAIDWISWCSGFSFKYQSKEYKNEVKFSVDFLMFSMTVFWNNNQPEHHYLKSRMHPVPWLFNFFCCCCGGSGCRSCGCCGSWWSLITCCRENLLTQSIIWTTNLWHREAIIYL